MATDSIDFRGRILTAYDKVNVTRDEIARRFCVSLGMVKKLIQQRCLLGNIRSHRQAIREEHAVKPDVTPEEIVTIIGLDCTIRALHSGAWGRGAVIESKTLPASKEG